MRSLPLTPADALRLALLAALGLPAFTACGAAPIESVNDDSSTAGTGGTHATGGSTASGGQNGTGGFVGTGGYVATGGAGPVGCSSPQPLMPGYDTGFYTCAEGYEHRTEKKTCPSFLPRPDEQPDSSAMGGSSSTDECDYDTDCPGPYGYCAQRPYWYDQVESGNVCATGCVSDSDCNPGFICRCGDPVGQCVPSVGSDPNGAGCSTDNDCGSGLLCVYVPQIGCGAGIAYACQTPKDECRTQADCGNGYDDCAFSPEASKRICVGAPVCGRPFLVDFLERRADGAERSDWTLSARTPSLGSLGEGERARLAAHWTDIALMEHASIAAFARFSLQLLSLGAPADLIEETNRALADETKHARLCFALASAYGGVPVGPGPLDVSGSLDGGSPEAILRTVIREGCLGETQAALEAAEAAALCEDAAVAEVLRVITADEARHAELAYRFVQWLLGEKPELESVAREEFSAALATLSFAPLPRSEEPSLSRYGVLDAASREHIRRRALTSVLAPCAEGLLVSGFALSPARPRVSRSVSLEALS